MIDFYAEIYKRYGRVRRARGFFLYTEKNVRLTDLYLDAGMSILGRKTGQSNLVAKQWLDRGLTGFFPTKGEYQLEKAVKAVLPSYQIIRWYHSIKKARDLLSAVLKCGQSADDIPVWRPFLESNNPQLSPEALLVTPMYPSLYGIIAAKATLESVLPSSDILFPPLAQSTARAFFDVQKKAAKKHGLSIKKNSLKERQLQELQSLVASFWTQQSCYLFPKISKAAYQALFYAALDAHILISPDYHIPSIIPDLDVYTECITFFKAYV